MQLSQLGNTGLYVSRLSLGTMTLGEADETSMFHGIGCKKDDAFKIIDHAIESGINFLDTANIYGQDGMVEKLLGEYFADRKNRKNLVIGTKFRFSTGDARHQGGASRKHIMDAVEDSLRRLKTDYIDLYQIHMQDLDTPEEETLRALDDLVHSGKVRYIGASNYALYRFAKAHALAREKNIHTYQSLQMQYHLLCRDIEREHVPFCESEKVGILVWSPLASGFLSGKYDRETLSAGKEESARKTWVERHNNDRSWRVIDCVKNMAKEIDKSPSQVALAWLLHKSYVTSVIIGARKMSQLEDNLLSKDLKLTEDQMIRLDEVSGEPMGYPYEFIFRRHGKW